jgi:VPDSG-CTERM motif
VGLEKLATTGLWNFSAQTLGLSTFTFSSTTTIPAQSVPEGGSTVALLGISLLGLAWMGRRQFHSKLA